MRVCVRPSAAVIAAAAGVGEGSCPCLTAYIDSTILGPYPLPAPSQANLTSIHTATLPACEHGLIPRVLDRPWTRPYETSRAILRHSLVRPVASIATSATRSPTKDCTYGGRPSACPRLRTRCRNRPVHHSRRLVSVKLYSVDLALRLTLDATRPGKRSSRDRSHRILD